MLDAATTDDERGTTRTGEVRSVQRPRLEAVWAEATFTDPVEKREARSRTCLARGGNVQTLITLDYWPEDADRFEPVWDLILATLKLDARVDLAGRPVITPPSARGKRR
jgi:hypothetical protein